MRWKEMKVLTHFHQFTVAAYNCFRWIYIFVRVFRLGMKESQRLNNEVLHATKIKIVQYEYKRWTPWKMKVEKCIWFLLFNSMFFWLRSHLCFVRRIIYVMNDICDNTYDETTDCIITYLRDGWLLFSFNRSPFDGFWKTKDIWAKFSLAGTVWKNFERRFQI